MNIILEIIKIINLAGVIGWILLFLYLFIGTICIERMYYFYYTRSEFDKLYTALSQTSEISEDLINPYLSSQNIKIIQSFQKNYSLSNKILNERLEREVFESIEEMESHIWILYQIAYVSPLLGLLGTVLGLISSFQIMATLGESADVAAFASGIWEAMITTAFGLIVAIPSVLLYKIFDKIVEKRSNQMTKLVSLLNEYHQNNQKIQIVAKQENVSYENI